jgi:hypothetical protein
MGPFSPPIGAFHHHIDARNKPEPGKAAHRCDLVVETMPQSRTSAGPRAKSGSARCGNADSRLVAFGCPDLAAEKRKPIAETTSPLLRQTSPGSCRHPLGEHRSCQSRPLRWSVEVLFTSTFFPRATEASTFAFVPAWQHKRRFRSLPHRRHRQEMLRLDLQNALRPLDVITGATTHGRHPESDIRQVLCRFRRQ